jgi:citrate lyase subunit beta/citryl-CoA lyase
MARPMRSWMFVPGDNQRFLAKAATTTADAVYLDLEDGVLPDRKTIARGLVAETLALTDFAPYRYVRINAIDTPWHDDDLEAIVVPGLDGVCLAKTQRPGDVTDLIGRLEELERERGLDTGSVKIMAAVESAAALLLAPRIATASDRVIGLMFGAEDFALDLGLGTHRRAEAAELVFARSSLVIAAAAERRLSVDGVFPDLDDPEGLERDVIQARRLGFTSKSTFNPRQIDLINRIFSPQPDEIEYARKVVAAFEEAQSTGSASVAVGGQLVDLPIVMRAQHTLDLVAELGMEEN